ncbi:MAG: TIGR00159 family protein [Pseudobdellovibrionaceae bacterium]|nr:diadenylate cyclase CdaA [Bdellovibrionales bacterium]USN48953.1 MAG: TIGR00159 family protein [Pseudobdellovibrionaceae bacterium]
MDVLDLFLVWLVFYRVLLLIRHSGAIQILTGIAVLALGFKLSGWLELHTLHLILEMFFSNLFLVAVILFQGEIRRALAQIGSRPFMGGQTSIQASHVIEELAQGSIQLAQKGWGALIVIEREIALDYFVEPGTTIDGEVRAPVINSLFHPASPLHDGAMIVRNGRILSAGNFLPLSKNPALDKNLGTRHRAAIGLTEETDAVVLVVSEENKSVSGVQSGKLSTELDHSGLRTFLYEIYGMVPGSEARGSS